jgi:hypothetical protein
MTKDIVSSITNADPKTKVFLSQTNWYKELIKSVSVEEDLDDYEDCGEEVLRKRLLKK